MTKVYGLHYCDVSHRTYQAMAKCMWRRAVWIEGDGPYALLARCRVLTVTLHADLAGAVVSKRPIDGSGCGGLCHGDHEIVQLVLPTDAA
ncbi:MAG: hypothetical protein ACRDPQ_14060 [Nocardioidaceae bacterium]